MVAEHQSELLSITAIGPQVYVHVSYLKTESFGKVACNGLVYLDRGEALIVDAPANNAASRELLHWITRTAKAQPKAVIINHFHEDCLGGLPALHEAGVASYAFAKTCQLAAADSTVRSLPQNCFDESLVLRVGAEQTITVFPGEGHTRDNTVTYLRKEKVLFGGCLVKALQASKGYLADANVQTWSASIAAVKSQFPDAQVVVPGHGAIGDQSLLDYTMQLFAD